MKNSVIRWSIIVLLVVSWCWRPWSSDEQKSPAEKEQFFIETATVWELRQSSQLSKNWILLWENTVTVTAQVGWRVQDVAIEIGDEVQQGAEILSLRDTGGSISFGVERARAALDQARINYESTLLSLDQQIDETRRSIRQTQVQQQNAQIQADNAALEWSSASRLQLQQLEQQLTTAELDLNTKIQSDDQTIINFLNSAQNIQRDARLLYQEVLDETDQILWVSAVNERENDRFEWNLAARNTALRFRTESALRQLLNQQNVLEDLTITQASLWSDLRYIQETLEELTPYLQLFEEMLSFTTTWRDLSEQELAWFNQLADSLQAQVQWQVSWITQQINSIESFLRTYQDQQASIRQNIEWLETQIAATRENLETAQRSSSLSVDTASLSVESAQARLDDLIDTRAVTERSLSNAITQSQIALREVQTNASKFSVSAPIQWTIGEFLVDVWQEVSPWTPLFTITSTTDLEIEIGLTSNEVELVNEGQRVVIFNGSNELEWTLESITRTANQSLSYKATVIPDQSPELLWWVVRVILPLESNQLLLPLKNVQIITTDIGRITVYQNNTIETLSVDLGSIQWSNIVIDEPLDNSLQIITSPVRTYDATKFEVVVRE